MKTAMISGLIALFASALLTTPAAAVNIHNCTSKGIRVFVYNQNDAVMAITKKKFQIDARGKITRGKLPGRDPHKFKIFVQQLLDKPVLTQTGIKKRKTYYFYKKGGRYRLETKKPRKGC